MKSKLFFMQWQTVSHFMCAVMLFFRFHSPTLFVPPFCVYAALAQISISDIYCLGDLAVFAFVSYFKVVSQKVFGHFFKN